MATDQRPVSHGVSADQESPDQWMRMVSSATELGVMESDPQMDCPGCKECAAMAAELGESIVCAEFGRIVRPDGSVVAA